MPKIINYTTTEKGLFFKDEWLCDPIDWEEYHGHDGTLLVQRKVFWKDPDEWEHRVTLTRKQMKIKYSEAFIRILLSGGLRTKTTTRNHKLIWDYLVYQQNPEVKRDEIL